MGAATTRTRISRGAGTQVHLDPWQTKVIVSPVGLFFYSDAQFLYYYYLFIYFSCTRFLVVVLWLVWLQSMDSRAPV